MEQEQPIPEIIEPFNLKYADLVLLSLPSNSHLPNEELLRLQNISENIMETLGPHGLGLLTITGVPNGSGLRGELLPLARKLALLGSEDRKRVLKEHKLGSDVSFKNPDRTVSSFAMQLKYAEDPSLDLICYSSSPNSETEVKILDKFPDNLFKNLGNNFKDLGICMMELGLQLARVCDRAIGGNELEQSILDSCTAKGRLIHYHSPQDNLFLKISGRRKRSTKKNFNQSLEPSNFSKQSDIESKEQILGENPKGNACKEEARSNATSRSDFWQQWHYDYGIFTVLTTPIFILPGQQPTFGANNGMSMLIQQECLPPDKHTYLQLFDPNKNRILVVRSPPESFIVQVGESADILSNGKLHSTLHSVCRPGNQESLSRETFVVFLQPSWNKTFSVSQQPKEKLISNQQFSNAWNDKCVSRTDHINSYSDMFDICREIDEIVPPLSSRLKDGMTFADFSRETTKQYYSGSGMQSKR